MKKIGGHIEGLILLALGLYLGGIIAFGDYWRYMNPRFEWISGGAVLMLIVTGGVAMLRSRHKADFSGILIFLVFLGVAALNTHATLQSPPMGVSREKEDVPENRSRLFLNGVDYIKINVAELTQHCLDKDSERTSKRYVTRGMVKRHPELDEKGQFALIRVAAVCCLAHALPVGFTVQWGQPDKLREGQWVEVYGDLVQLPPDVVHPYLEVEGFFFTHLNTSFAILPTKIIAISQPQPPYIFEFQSDEPYAY
jgi:hypothetical protein